MKLCGHFLSVALFAFATVIFGGCTQVDNTMGTGTAVIIGGGGDYAAIIESMKASVRWTLNEIATKPSLAARLGESNTSLTAAQKTYLRQIITTNAATAAANMARSQVKFTSQNLTDRGVAVRATVEKTATGYLIMIRESSVGEAWPLLVHELLHTAAALDDLATPAEFPQGLRAGLDFAGQFVEALWKRFNPADLDPSFGNNGAVIAQALYPQRYLVTAPQGGYFVLTSETRPGENGNECVVSKLKSDLTLDANFGTAGSYKTAKFWIPSPPTVAAGDAISASKTCHSLAVQPDGKIVVVGSEIVPNYRFVGIAFRLTADGRIDSEFNSGLPFVHTMNLDVPLGNTYPPAGYWYPSRGSQFIAVAIDSDGKILLAGRRIFGAGTPDNANVIDSRLMRLLPDGTPDPTFGVSGISSALDDGPWSIATRITLQPDGKILTLGAANDVTGVWVSRATITRVLSNGQLDTSYGTNGRTYVKTTLPDSTAPDCIPQEMALMPDGKLVVTTRTGLSHGTQSGILVARLTPSGAIDTTFALGGRFSFSMPDAAGELASQYGSVGIVPLDNGRVVITSSYTNNSGTQGLLIGLDSVGKLDVNFKNAAGLSKIVTFAIGGQPTAVRNGLPQPDGKFLVYGTQLRTDGNFLFVARFTGSSMP